MDAGQARHGTARRGELVHRVDRLSNHREAGEAAHRIGAGEDAVAQPDLHRVLALVVAGRAPAAAPAPAAPGVALAALVEAYWQEHLALNPLQATVLGDHRYDAELPNNLSTAHLGLEYALEKRYLGKLAAIDDKALAGQDALTYEVFRRDRELELEGYRYQAELLPVNQYEGVDTPLGDQPCGKNGLSKGGGCRKNAQVVCEQGVRGELLFRPQLAFERGDTMFTGHYAWYNVYQTKDGKYISIGAFEPWFYANLCQLLGRDDFIEHQFAEGEKREEISQYFKQTFLTKSRDEWLAILRQKDTCVAPVYSMDELVSDPQLISRGLINELPHPVLGSIRQVGSMLKMSSSPFQVRNWSTRFGQHTDEILQEIGYDAKRIDALRRAGVIG